MLKPYSRRQIWSLPPYVRPERVVLRTHPELSEKWVQDLISRDTQILGLGDLVLLQQERIQPSGGRLDLLLQDPNTKRRYEVKLQLGAVDESHIIGTIEYWDKMRSDPVTICDDQRRLATRIAALRAGLVVFDGCQGVGKSSLARSIAELIGCEAISADEHVERGRGCYVAALRIDGLKCSVSGALERSPVVIFDGVCARDIVDRLGFVPALFVYVQRNSSAGVPGDLDVLDQEDRLENQGIAEDFRELDIEIANYHRRRRPRRNADIVYIQMEKDITLPTFC
jgi:hypothetical protein